MSRWLAVIAVVVAFAGVGSADYVLDRRAALAFVHADKNEEALAAFVKMAANAMSGVQKADALEQAVLCAARLKQYDRAHELAKQVPLAPLAKICQMRIMESERRWQDIVARFKNEDFDSWPESVRGDAYHGRGYSYLVTKNGAAAASDLRQAVEYFTDLNSKGQCLNYLGDTYKQLLKDDDKAIEAYRKTYGAGNIYKHCQAAISIAGILTEQKKHDAAILEFTRVNMAEVTAPFWRGKTLCALGIALAGAGKTGEAQAKFNEALQLKDLPEEIRKHCEKALKDLRGK